MYPAWTKMITRRLAVVAMILCALIISCLKIIDTPNTAAGQPTKRALLIGIDDYKADHISDLRGCVNDVMLMREILVGKFDVPPDNIKVLTNRQATRAAIIDAIRTHLINKAQKNDIIILQFSGHGSQMGDASGDEIDGRDETLVPHDSRTAGVYDISDDEINGLLKQLSEKTKYVTFIFDSCHSGDAARAGNTVRMIEPDDRPPPPPADFAISSRGAEGDSDIRLEGSDYVLISGCLAKELSNESSINGRRHGVLTWYLCESLKAAVDHTTYRAVMDEVKMEVSARFPSQHPQIEGPGTDLVVFGADRINAQAYVLVKPIGGQKVEVDGGKVYGLRRDTTLKVYAPKTADFKKAGPIATIKVIMAEDFKAEAKILEGGPVQPQSRAALEAVFFGDTAIPVFVDAEKSESLGKVKDALTSFEALSLVKDEASARLLVKEQNGKIVIQTGDLEVLVPPVPLTEQGHVERVVNQVKDLVHWMTVLDLKNPDSSIKISFGVRRKDEPPGAKAPGMVTSGTKLTYRVKNNGDQPLYIYVLDVSSDGSITLLYPTGGQNELRKDGMLEKTIEMYLPEGRTEVIDVLKVLATTQPIDPSVFPQGSIRMSPPAETRADADPLTQFLSRAMRGLRAAKPVDVQTWVTKQTSVRIREAGESVAKGEESISSRGGEQKISIISQSNWNSWFHRENKPFGVLEENHRYTFTLDLAAYAYRVDGGGAVGSAPGDVSLQHIIEESAKEKETTVKLIIRPVLLGNNLEFPPDAPASDHLMEVILEKLLLSEKRKQTYESYKAKRLTLGEFADLSYAGRVSFDVVARHSGCATIALSIWDESGVIPLDHLLHTIEVADSETERKDCGADGNKNALRGGLASLVSESVAEKQAVKPDAALHIFEHMVSGRTRSIAVFVNGKTMQSAAGTGSDRGVFSWEMRGVLSTYVSDAEGLLYQVKQARKWAMEDDKRDSYIGAAIELRKYIFSASPNDPRGQENARAALESLQQLVADSEKKPVVLARLVDSYGKRLFLPLGLLSSAGKEPVLTKPILVVQPLQKDRHRAPKGCIDNWTFGLPKILDAMPSPIREELERIDTNKQFDWVHWVRDLTEFEEYLQGTGDSANGEGLLLLAHNSKGRVWFVPEEGRLTQNDFLRKYPSGSVAILAACSAGDLTGDNGILLEELSRSGIDALVISPFPINARYGGQLALAFGDAIIAARNKGQNATIAELFSTAAEMVAKQFEGTRYSSYGQMSQEFIIAGDQNLRLCGKSQ